MRYGETRCLIRNEQKIADRSSRMDLVENQDGSITIYLVMFAIPLVFGLVSPYFGSHIPGFEQGQLIYAIVGDVLLLTSLFVLGGGFWDKLRSLFKHDAYAVIPDEPAAERKSE